MGLFYAGFLVGGGGRTDGAKCFVGEEERFLFLGGGFICPVVG